MFVPKLKKSDNHQKKKISPLTGGTHGSSIAMRAHGVTVPACSEPSVGVAPCEGRPHTTPNNTASGFVPGRLAEWV